MLDRAYILAERLIARLERIIELLEQLATDRDHARN
jgi:hypothetical protein